MSQDNPFADPFAPQPSSQQQYSSNSQYGTTSSNNDDFNPFADQQKAAPAPFAATPAPVIAPATIEPTRAPPPAYSGVDPSMQQRQDELERKAQELARKEEELNNIQRTVDKAKNFPPLPKFCCAQPCFYHDISVEIPMEMQRNCRMLFYVWQLYVFVLMYNFICGLALLCTGGNDGAQTFGVSLVYLVLFTPCSFVFWYRPVYKALATNSSFNFMLFFFMFFMQIVFSIIYTMGIGGFGTCGWINAAKELDSGNSGVAAMMFICAALWSVLVLFKILLYKRIHGLYRSSGASIQKAQGEFARDVMSNKNVQNAAAEAVRGGIQGGNSSTNTY